MLNPLLSASFSECRIRFHWNKENSAPVSFVFVRKLKVFVGAFPI